MQGKTHFSKSLVKNTEKLYYFLLQRLFIYSKLFTKLPTTLLLLLPIPSSTFSSTHYSTLTHLTCIYSRKLLMLSVCFLMSATTVVGQQWVGLFSQTPNSSVLTSTGSTNNTSEVSIKIPGFYVTETVVAGKSYQYPSIPDGHPILDKGSPDLQKLNFTLQLPATGDMKVSVVYSEYKDYPNYEIPPSIGNELNSSKFIIPTKGQVYETDAFYPSQLINSKLPFTIRNTRNQVFEVYPFQYNPSTHVLRFYYNLSFKIENIGGQGIHPLSSNDLKIVPVNGIGVTSLNDQFNATRSCNTGPIHGSLLIICPEEFKTAIEPLLKWRIQTGVNTKLVVAKQFKDSLEIHNIVKKQYAEDSTFAYLLLVGDSKQMPTNLIKNIASDNYYSYLSGIEPLNEHYPDIMVGRFSAENARDVEVQVKRTLEYEIMPGCDGNWLGVATGIGSNEKSITNSEPDCLHIRRLMDKLKSTTYKSTNELYDGSLGLGDANGNPSASDITSKINEGTGVVFYAGHGFPNGWSTGSVTTASVKNLNNNGKYPIIWSASCQTGSFANNFCFAESWLRATDSKGKPTGAVAALMASGLLPAPPAKATQQNISEHLCHPQIGISTLGAITINSLIKMNRDEGQGTVGYETTNSWILFGDPALNIRTTKPKKLVVSHKGTISLEGNAYSITSNADGGFACISREGEILGTASLIQGKASINLKQLTVSDSLTLTVTAFNYLPYISGIKVSEKPGDIENPSPLNHSELQAISKIFSWEKGEGDTPIYYLFSLGTDNPPSNLVDSKKITGTQFAPELRLEYGKKYYWQVTPVGTKGQTNGKVLDFVTIGEPDEDFESDFKSGSAWQNAGANQWVMDASNFFDGQYALRSGHIQNNEHSSLIYSFDVKYCDFISFWARTSSCQGDKLQFSIDSVIMGEWGGNMDWGFQVFKVNPGMHLFEWRYSKDNNNVAGTDAAWIDDIHMPNHALAMADVMESSSVCEGLSLETSVTAKNQTAVIWQTEGDGTFNDINLPNAQYQPGELDKFYGNTKLQMNLIGFNGCPVNEKTMRLKINPLPVIPLPSDTIVSNGNSVVLDASLNGNVFYNWLPCGSNNPSVEIDSIASKAGTKIVNITVTNTFGCTASKSIQVHFISSNQTDVFNIFPNPSNGNFVLQPEKGIAIVSSIQLLGMDGKVLWSNSDGFTIIGETKIAIPNLAVGVYLLATTTNNGLSTNKVFIR